jgi:predicted PurR-regulated permease PerM
VVELAPGDDDVEPGSSTGSNLPVNGSREPATGAPDPSEPVDARPTTVISETAVEIRDRQVGSDAPRRERLFAAASAKGVPLRTILVVDAVVIATFVVYLLIVRLHEVILWILIAAFIAVVLNPSVNFLQRHRFRRGTAIGIVFAGAILAFFGLLGLFGYPLVNSVTHVAERLPTMVKQVQKGHGWLAHTLQHFHLLTWVQKNAPKLETAAKNLSKPALSEGANLGKAVFGTILSILTIGFLSLFMLLEAPRLRQGVMGSIRADRRRTIEDVAHRIAHQVSGYVLGTIALSLMFGAVILVTLLILGVPFALLIGLWVALVAMIPLVGGLIAAVPSVLIALLHSPTAGLVTLIVFIGFQLVENHFIYPVVMSRSVRMNPLWVLLSVLIGANLGGAFGSALGALAGALVAIPVGGAIQLIFRELWERTRPGNEWPAGEPLPMTAAETDGDREAPPGPDGGARPVPEAEPGPPRAVPIGDA